jgi:nitrogen regulatory protein P-II 1
MNRNLKLDGKYSYEEIKAIIRPAKLPALREKLRSLPGFPGMTIGEVEGCSAPSVRSPSNLKEELTDCTRKVRIEIVAPEEVCDRIVETIIQNAQIRPNRDDGLVWVTPTDRAVFLFKTLRSTSNNSRQHSTGFQALKVPALR